ncbi:hypothetical protein DVH05_003513 [Phytophthora capsici]|nr:hypothetical protein DVH05_003513 [Phytophthora capsici]
MLSPVKNQEGDNSQMLSEVEFTAKNKRSTLEKVSALVQQRMKAIVSAQGVSPLAPIHQGIASLYVMRIINETTPAAPVSMTRELAQVACRTSV